MKRSEKKYPTIIVRGRWDLIGGRIDPEQGLRENLAREIREEAGMTLMGEPKLLCDQDIFYDLKGVPQHVVRLTYIANAASELVMDPEECEDLRWLSLEELMAKKEIDKYVKEIIDAGLI